MQLIVVYLAATFCNLIRIFLYHPCSQFLLSSNDAGKTSYYYVNKKRVPLEREESLAAVKFKDTTTLTRRDLDKDLEPIAVVPKYGLHIFRLGAPPSEPSMSTRN